MQLCRAQSPPRRRTQEGAIQSASDDHRAVPVGVNRTAGVVTLVGCSATILAAFLPSIERAFGISLTASGLQGEMVLLVVLAVMSGGIAGFALLRRPATPALAIILTALALAEVCLAIWHAGSVAKELEQFDSGLLFGRLIGTGAYGCILGSAMTLAGGVLAWTKRESRTDQAISDRI